MKELVYNNQKYFINKYNVVFKIGNKYILNSYSEIVFIDNPLKDLIIKELNKRELKGGYKE